MKIYACIILIIGLIVGLVSWAGALDISDVKVGELLKPPPPAQKWGRDPFVRYDEGFKPEEVVREKDFISFKINGIISDGRRSLAIIGGEFYRKGDSISGFRILDIAGDRILLEKDGKKFYLGVDRFTLSVKAK